MSNAPQRSFAVGEIGPSLWGMADRVLYGSALRTCRNFVVAKEGGVRSRAGTTYQGTAKSATAGDVTRVIDCVFSSSQPYVLEFGNLYIRFWLNGTQVTFSTPSAWADATPYVIGDLVSYSGTNYLCIASHTSVLADNRPSTGSSWQTKWYAQTGVILEWPTTYVTADLFRIQHRHPDASSVVLVHPSYPPKRLTRVSATNWNFQTITFSSDLSTPTNLAVSGSGGSGWGYTVTAVDAAGVESTAPAYVRTNVVSLDPADPFSIAAQIKAANRTVSWTAVTGAVKYRIYANTSASDPLIKIIGEATGVSFVDYGQWEFWPQFGYGSPPTSSGLFGSSDNYPGAAAVHQQRLMLAGTNTKPDTVYASRSADPLNFSARSPIQDDDMLSWRQIGPRVNRVLHMVAYARALVSFDEAGEHAISGDTDSILRPGEVNPVEISSNGASANLSPLVMDQSALYVQACGNVVRDLRPRDGWGSADLSVTATHLLRGYTITDWAQQKTPDPVAWMVRSDGTLLSLTYSRETQVFAWARHDTDGFVESVCCVRESTVDALYLVVRRTINSTAVRYIERMADRTVAWPDTVCVDAALVSDSGGTAEAGTITITDGAEAAVGAVLTAPATLEGVVEAIQAPPEEGNQNIQVMKIAGGPFYVFPETFSGDSHEIVLDVAFKAAELSAVTIVIFCEHEFIADPDTSAHEITINLTTGAVTEGLSGTYAVPEVTVTEWADGWWRLRFRNAMANTTPPPGLLLPSFVAIGPSTAVAGQGVYFHDFRVDAPFWNDGTYGGLEAQWSDFAGEPISLLDGYDAGGTCNVHSSAGSAFAAGDVGSSIWVTYQSVDYFLTILAFIDGNDVVAQAHQAIPAGLQNVATSPWGFGASVVAGLSHLEGEAVSVVVDGEVIASPYNDAYPTLTVIDGELALPTLGTRAVVGLPFVCDLRTLDIESAGRSRKDKGVNVKRVGVWTDELGKVWVGQKVPTSSTALTDLNSLVMLDDENQPLDSDTLATGYNEITVHSRWSRSGAIFLRHVDPTPATIHALIPYFDEGG